MGILWDGFTGVILATVLLGSKRARIGAYRAGEKVGEAWYKFRKLSQEIEASPNKRRFVQVKEQVLERGQQVRAFGMDVWRSLNDFKDSVGASAAQIVNVERPGEAPKQREQATPQGILKLREISKDFIQRLGEIRKDLTDFIENPSRSSSSSSSSSQSGTYSDNVASEFMPSKSSSAPTASQVADSLSEKPFTPSPFQSSASSVSLDLGHSPSGSRQSFISSGSSHSAAPKSDAATRNDSTGTQGLAARGLDPKKHSAGLQTELMPSGADLLIESAMDRKVASFMKDLENKSTS